MLSMLTLAIPSFKGGKCGTLQSIGGHLETYRGVYGNKLGLITAQLIKQGQPGLVGNS
jgi:hypothetical protein